MHTVSDGSDSQKSFEQKQLNFKPDGAAIAAPFLFFYAHP